jgi:zinc protease
MELDRMAVTLDSMTDSASVAATIVASGLASNAPEWLAIMARMVVEPDLDADRLSALRAQGRLGLVEQRGSAAFLAEEALYSAVYGNHPASRRSPDYDALQRISHDDVLDWHQDHYVPGNTTISIETGVPTETALTWIEQAFGLWENPAGAASPPTTPPPTLPAPPREIRLVDRLDAAQTTFLVGNLSIRRNDPDYAVFRVLNEVLGAGPASRLAAGLAGDSENAFVAYSAYSALEYPGLWVVSAAARTADSGPAIDGVLNQIRRLGEELVPEAELDRAKRAVVRGFALSLEQPESRLSFTALGEAHGLDAGYWSDYAARVMAVTPDDVRRVAVEYWDADTAHIVAVGDAASILSVIEQAGPVTLYDTAGNRLGTPE